MMPSGDLIFPVLKVAIVVVIYVVVARRLMQFARPIRVGVMARAGYLLGRDRLPEIHADAVRFLAANLLNGWMPWMIVALVPVSVAVELLKRVRGRHSVDVIADPLLEREYGEFVARALFIIVAQSPLALILLFIQALVIVLFSGPWRFASASMAAVIRMQGQLARFHLARLPAGRSATI
jgi:hypothetical protein